MVPHAQRISSDDAGFASRVGYPAEIIEESAEARMELHYELDRVRTKDRTKKWHWKVIHNGRVVYDGYAATEEQAAHAAGCAADSVMDALQISFL